MSLVPHHPTTACRRADAPGPTGRERSRRSRRLAAVAVSGVAMLAAMPAIASANQVIAFPERDFLSGTGFTPGATVNYTVTHPATGASFTAAVRADLDGLAEVNHPGGICWTTMTPDVKAGDTVTANDGIAADAVTFTVPNTQVQRVTNPAPDTIVVKGWASTDGGPTTPGTTRIPDDQVESRIVAPRNQFALNGKRTLRARRRAAPTARSRGTAPTVTTYTATYSGLSQADVDLAMSVGEARTLWLGSDPLAPRDGTIFESGDPVIGGSSAGFCDGTAGSIANIPSETPSTNLNPGLTPTTASPADDRPVQQRPEFSAKPGGNTNTQTLRSELVGGRAGQLQRRRHAAQPRDPADRGHPDRRAGVPAGLGHVHPERGQRRQVLPAADPVHVAQRGGHLRRGRHDQRAEHRRRDGHQLGDALRHRQVVGVVVRSPTRAHDLKAARPLRGRAAGCVSDWPPPCAGATSTNLPCG